MTLSPRNEIRPLTGVRGVAALYVVIYHVLFPDWFMFNRHGYLAVDLFFVLSGFVMALSYARLFENGFSGHKYGVFLVRRLARVYPLYIFATCAYGFATMAGVIDLDGLEPPLWWPMLTNVLMVQAWGFSRSILRPLWSISTEWAAYLAFPILAAGFLFSRWRLALLLAGASLLVLGGLAIMPKHSLNDWRMGPLDISWIGTPLPVVRCLAEFCLGLFAYRASTRADVRTIAAHPLVAPLLAASIVLLLCVPATDVAIVALLPLFIVSLAHGTGPVQSVLGSRPIFFLGQLSYAIYVLHPRLNSFYNRPAALLEPWIGYEAAWRIAFLAVLLLLSWLAHELVEKPGRRILRGLEPSLDRASQGMLVNNAKVESSRLL